MTVQKLHGESHTMMRSGSIDSSMSSDPLYTQNTNQLTDAEVNDTAVRSFALDGLSYQFHGSSGNLSTNSSSYLPNEFQVIQEPTVPLLQNLQEADQDFMIITEFSEIEGPIPICTIPSNAQEKTEINLNGFAVHLMPTDYQVNTAGQFGVCEDTQVLRTNVFVGTHVAMQYFTLYDIKARGFVRPFCFGYISRDHVKLDRIVLTLFEQFSEISKILKYTNRVWFASELTQYLQKLGKAKEESLVRTSGASRFTQRDETSFVQDPLGEFSDGDDIKSNSEDVVQNDSEVISLSQITQQYSEIERILQIVNESLTDPSYNQIGTTLNHQLLFSPESKLQEKLNQMGFFNDTFGSLNIPLVHPLKEKAESLRPMTTLGQMGTVILVQNLKRIYLRNRQDLIFTEMDTLTDDFRNHFRLARGIQPTVSSTIANLFELDQNDEEVGRILETINESVPIVPSDNTSGSYHTISSQDSEELGCMPETLNSDDAVSTLTTPTASGSTNTIIPVKSTRFPVRFSVTSSSSSSPNSESGSTSLRFGSPLKDNHIQEFLCRTDINSSWTIIEPRKRTASQSADESSHLCLPAVTADEVPLSITKVPWWTYAAKSKLTKGDPGYGLRKFWIHFSKVAHHLLYSLLLGRPIVIFGHSKYRSKVIQIINSLVPLVPCHVNQSFQVLHWHQGILVLEHLSGKYKLIGLCIPERLSIHDLLHLRDQNTATLLDVEKKHIFGPAYSGGYFKVFEEGSIQKKFLNDLSLLTYLGGILMDIETQIYMYRSLQESVSWSKYVKARELKNSDLEILKALSSLVVIEEEVVNIF